MLSFMSSASALDTKTICNECVAFTHEAKPFWVQCTNALQVIYLQRLSACRLAKHRSPNDFIIIAPKADIVNFAVTKISVKKGQTRCLQILIFVL